MSAFEHCRRYPRAAIKGVAMWSHGRDEGRCKIVDLSVGGAALRDPDAPLNVGLKLSFAIRVGGVTIAPIRAEVVRVADGGLALKCLAELTISDPLHYTAKNRPGAVPRSLACGVIAGDGLQPGKGTERLPRTAR